MLNCPCPSLAQEEPVSPLYGELTLPLAIPGLADPNVLCTEELVLLLNRKPGPLYLEKLAPVLSTGVGELTLPLT